MSKHAYISNLYVQTVLSNIDIEGFDSAHDAYTAYYERPLANIVPQASCYKPQDFTHPLPCHFYLPLFLAGVRSANIVNLRPSERMSVFSHLAATRLSIRDRYCPFSPDNLRFCSQICSLLVCNFQRSLASM